MSDRLEALFEADGLPVFDLPAELVALYGGQLGFDEPRLIANFVSTLDGVVAIPSLPQSNRLVADSSRADRFVMGLLRACSDAVVVGAGTLSGSPGSVWTPERAYPDAAAGFSELRRRLGRGPNPELVVVTGSGRIDPQHPALEIGALVLTGEAGAARLAGRLPRNATLVSIGEGDTVDPLRLTAALTERGHRRVLSEGGPHAIAPLVAAGLVDELFLTLSPLLLGRGEALRLGLIEGADLLPGTRARLLGVRRSSEHLFLRYVLGGH